MKFPPFIKRKQLEDHIEKHGFGDNVISIEIHCINASNKRSAGTAKISIRPFSIHDDFISVLNGSRLLGKHVLSVEPYHERKQSTKAPPRNASQIKQELQVKEQCVVFVGPILLNYINKADIQAHFREYKDAITGIKFKGNRQRRGCHVLLTFKSSSFATRAIDRYNQTVFLGKHKIKVDFYKPHHSMLSSASCPTMPVSTNSSMLTPSTKSTYVSTMTTAEVSSLNDKTYSSDQPDTLDKMTSTTKYQSAGCHSVGQLSSTVPMDCDFGENSTLGAAAANKELISNCYESEDDQLQHTVTTVIVENLDPNVNEKEIESLTGVVITCYTPSHQTPGKVAAWIEVANSKNACTIAEKLDGKVIHGRKVYCSLTDSHTLQQQMHSFEDPPKEQLPCTQSVHPNSLTDSHVSQQHVHSFPTFEDPYREPLPLSQPIPPSSESLITGKQQHTHTYPTFRSPPEEQWPLLQPISDHAAQQEYLTLFFLGDQPPGKQPQATFPQKSTVPFLIPSDSQLPVPVLEQAPPAPAALL